MIEVPELSGVIVKPFAKRGVLQVLNLDNGTTFHKRYFDGETELKINLPKGKFDFIGGVYKKTVSPEKYNLSKLVLPPKDRHDEKEYFFSYSQSFPGPARIFPTTGKIEVGPLFAKQTEQIQDFIILHELGHFYYDKEENADIYALKKFLESGGNQSAAFDALERVISKTPENIQRIKQHLNNIKKT